MAAAPLTHRRNHGGRAANPPHRRPAAATTTAGLTTRRTAEPLHRGNATPQNGRTTDEQSPPQRPHRRSATATMAAAPPTRCGYRGDGTTETPTPPERSHHQRAAANTAAAAPIFRIETRSRQRGCRTADPPYRRPAAPPNRRTADRLYPLQENILGYPGNLAETSGIRRNPGILRTAPGIRWIGERSWNHLEDT